LRGMEALLPALLRSPQAGLTDLALDPFVRAQLRRMPERRDAIIS
jgi:hypothetical protein